eukprot:4508445-Alexandrium_andersonii.AAC.1
MSASLVGSEMCIRDSFGSANTLPDPPVWRLRHSESTSRGGPGKAVVPVSYTHLTLPTICSV